ncbi:putative mfs-multidrug-resistance transporter [Violaceomyces palustris]|uniref:Mfs-multidrug-resistance transporter n=1 Tax=Violaceomyces palustris TaxID=1673888 RepID=A0ACD0NT94_9BASI|nr:putative mfs-multidrug-resistance transporter [Violaceomyces palustris]
MSELGPTTVPPQDSGDTGLREGQVDDAVRSEGRAEYPASDRATTPSGDSSHRRQKEDDEKEKPQSSISEARGEVDEEKLKGEDDGVPTDPNEVWWDGPNDPENPQNWSNTRKWVITLVAATLTINVTFSSTAPASATMKIAREYGLSQTVATLVTSLFLCGYVLGPIVWSAASELYGRRLIFIISIAMYVLFILGQALAKNPETLLVTRFLSGVSAAAPLTNSGGLIADIWDPVTRGHAMSLFSASVFIGPVMGPIVGGFIAGSTITWKWIFWIMMIFGGVVWVLTILFIPETYGPVLLLKKAKRLRKEDPVANKDKYASLEKGDWSLKGIAQRTIYKPFIILAKEPILVLITIYLSVVYGILYGCLEAFPIIFAEKRGLNFGETGLIFLGIGIGSTLGSIINTYLQYHYKYLVPFWKGMPPPEERLSSSIIAGPMLVIGSFWLGWTGGYASVPWYVPALSTILLGMSFNLVFISFLTYIVDTYLMHAASALAVNTIFRSAVGAAFPLFTSQMFHGMTIQWACTMLGFISLALAPSPIIFYLYGARIRQLSKFAPCIDLKIRKGLEAAGKLPKDSLTSKEKGARNGLPQAKKMYYEMMKAKRDAGDAAAQKA